MTGWWQSQNQRAGLPASPWLLVLNRLAEGRNRRMAKWTLEPDGPPEGPGSPDPEPNPERFYVARPSGAEPSALGNQQGLLGGGEPKLPRTQVKAQMIIFTPTTSQTGHLNAGASVSLSVTETIRAILPIPLVVSWFGRNVEEDLGSYLKWGRTTSLAASDGCQQWARSWAEQRGSSGLIEVQGQGQRDGGGGTSKTGIMESMDKSESKEVALLGTGWGPLFAACLSGA